jgi:hypothetical protein
MILRRFLSQSGGVVFGEEEMQKKAVGYQRNHRN